MTRLALAGDFKSSRAVPEPVGMVPAAIPQDTGPGLPANWVQWPRAGQWLLLLVAGILCISLAALWEGILVVQFFDHIAPPPSPAYNAFEWGQAYSEILFGVGILFSGLGGALDERIRQVAQYPAVPTPSRRTVLAGTTLVVLGASIAASGELLAATLAILGLEGIETLPKVLGTSWSLGLPDVLLGLGLLLVGVGVAALWLARQRAARFA